MKSFSIALVGNQGENLSTFEAVIFEISNTKLTKQVAEYLQTCENVVNRHNLKNVLLEISSGEKSVDVKYTNNLLTCSFAVLKALPKLVFSSTAKSFDAHIRTKSEVLLNIAAVFNLKRESITFNEYVSAIEAKESVKKALVYSQKQAVKNEVLNTNEQALLIHVKEMRKAVKESNDNLKKLTSDQIKEKVEQYYLTLN